MTEPDTARAAETGTPEPPASPAPFPVREVAAETLRVVAWILTPEDGYEPVDEPVPKLLRAVACRLLESHPARDAVVCGQVAEVAATAAVFVLAVRHAPADATDAADQISPLRHLEAVSRAALPEVLLTAARVCQHAPVNEAPSV
jgi:hypothetical protein